MSDTTDNIPQIKLVKIQRASCPQNTDPDSPPENFVILAPKGTCFLNVLMLRLYIVCRLK